MIIALRPVSAAFNPVITALERLTGALPSRHAVALSRAQILGGLVGVVGANLLFSEPAVSLSTTERGGPGRWLGAVVATAGLVLLITALSRTGRPQLIGWAVGACITAGYWFTSSTSFANPAVTIARMFSNTFAGIQPASVPMFLRPPDISTTYPTDASRSGPPDPNRPTRSTGSLYRPWPKTASTSPLNNLRS